MPFVMKEYEPLDPVNIRFFGFWTIVPRTNGLANLIEELWSRCARGRGAGRDGAPADHFESLVGEALHRGVVHGNLLVVNGGQRYVQSTPLRELCAAPSFPRCQTRARFSGPCISSRPDRPAQPSAIPPMFESELQAGSILKLLSGVKRLRLHSRTAEEVDCLSCLMP